jgi:hypothetical protein
MKLPGIFICWELWSLLFLLTMGEGILFTKYVMKPAEKADYRALFWKAIASFRFFVNEVRQ